MAQIRCISSPNISTPEYWLVETVLVSRRPSPEHDLADTSTPIPQSLADELVKNSFKADSEVNL